MNLAFPAHFEQDVEFPHLWGVRIPGLDGSDEGPVTCGTGLEDARRMASGLVDAWIGIHLKEGRSVPTPGPLSEGPGWELVHPGLQTQFVVILRELRSKSKMSQSEVARKMGVKQPMYARLEDPEKANPTLKTVEAASRVFGVQMFNPVA